MSAAASIMWVIASTACALFAAPWVGAALNSTIPSFEATTLSGEKVTDAKLIGQPTILIVTPSKAAAETRESGPMRCAKTWIKSQSAFATCWLSICRSS